MGDIWTTQFYQGLRVKGRGLLLVGAMCVYEQGQTESEA